MNFPQIDDLLRPSLRIFFSIDLLGSTAFKQRESKQPGDGWLPVFLGFYQDSHLFFQEEWTRVCSVFEKNRVKGLGEAPAFWKGAGDEVIFTKQLRSVNDALGSILCLKGVVAKHRAVFTDKRPDLNIKSTAWTAGFPVTNAEIAISGRSKMPLESETLFDNLLRVYLYKNRNETWSDPELARAARDMVIDYLGPSIDLGFRLSGWATARRIPVSLELLMMLSRACTELRPEVRKALENDLKIAKLLRIHYDKRRDLKGIIFPYPLVWIDGDPENLLNQAEDQLSGAKVLPYEQLEVFCERFLDNTTLLRYRPYIETPDGTVSFGEIPDVHRKIRKDMADNFKAEHERSRQLLEERFGNGDKEEDKELDEKVQAFADIISEPHLKRRRRRAAPHTKRIHRKTGSRPRTNK